jgi:hypothetical protein
VDVLHENIKKDSILIILQLLTIQMVMKFMEAVILQNVIIVEKLSQLIILD